jgi:hypothetical protein
VVLYLQQCILCLFSRSPVPDQYPASGALAIRLSSGSMMQTVPFSNACSTCSSSRYRWLLRPRHFSKLPFLSTRAYRTKTNLDQSPRNPISSISSILTRQSFQQQQYSQRMRCPPLMQGAGNNVAPQHCATRYISMPNNANGLPSWLRLTLKTRACLQLAQFNHQQISWVILRVETKELSSSISTHRPNSSTVPSNR